MPQRQLKSGCCSAHFSFTNFFKECTSILLNNCFWFWLREQEQQLKACPLKGEKSAEGKNNSIALDYGGFPGLPLKPCLIKIQHVMHQFNNKGPYSHLLFLICTSPAWVWGWPFCLWGCNFNAKGIRAICNPYRKFKVLLLKTAKEIN